MLPGGGWLTMAQKTPSSSIALTPRAKRERQGEDSEAVSAHRGDRAAGRGHLFAPLITSAFVVEKRRETRTRSPLESRRRRIRTSLGGVRYWGRFASPGLTPSRDAKRTNSATEVARIFVIT